ncbi:MAG: CBS domain-containing protein [candidate division WOR-3 bacterium]|nr:MAG: CBS domain-containing protein [candidate division WOR-3 bacterium]
MDIEKLPVATVMRRNAPTVSPSTTLQHLIEIMCKTNHYMLPVVEDDSTLLGIVNYRGILNIFRPFSRSVSEIVERMPFVEKNDDEDLNLELSPEMGTLILVADIVNTSFVSIKEDSTIREARRIMRLHNVETIPVVSDKKLVGVLSLLDILVYIFKEHDILTSE